VAAPAPARRRAKAGTGFANACRTDYPATVDQFVAACFPEPDSDHIKRWAKNVLLRAEPDQAARIVEMWSDEPVPDSDPRDITVPTLVVHGTADVIVPIAESRKLAAELEDVELVELEGAAHVPTMTRPDDVVAAIRRRFGRPTG
jgi:pimeloyl-ACP methyl ester carboxylesterase